MYMTDDAAFGMMDVAGGHKGWHEVGVEFGKKALSAAASVGGQGRCFRERTRRWAGSQSVALLTQNLKSASWRFFTR
jgi:hypothetical protein